MKFLNDLELEELFIKLKEERGQRNALLIRLVLETGARSVEALQVTKADIKDGGGVHLHGAKGSNDRTVPISAELFRDLQQYAAQMNDCDKLFPITTRRFRQIWARYRINPNLGLHALRHTYGVRLYNSGNDIHAVKTALGHKNISNTMVYLDFVEGVKKLRKSTKGMWKKKLGVA